MQAGERQLHLGLDARDLRDAKARRPRSGVAQQRGLADARLAAHDEHRALAAAHVLQQPVQHLALALPAPKTLPTLGGHRP